ncbi:MAG: hypothetical protein LBU64_00025 [Planctomycetota bacterium]|jgi:hypothetical protein|nr:hypothetical protein [Planctomycetota bacterium]
MTLDEQISLRFTQLAPTFNERSIRLFAAAEANAIGYGGVSCLSRITGLSRPTIAKGQREIAAGHPLDIARIDISPVFRISAHRRRTLEWVSAHLFSL